MRKLSITKFNGIVLSICFAISIIAGGEAEAGRIKKVAIGKDITFWGGGCDTQGVLPRGTPEDVKAEVLNRITDFAPGGGFVFCPVHNIQPEVPPENLVSMYDTLLDHGHYPLKFEGA